MRCILPHRFREKSSGLCRSRWLKIQVRVRWLDILLYVWSCLNFEPQSYNNLLCFKIMQGCHIVCHFNKREKSFILKYYCIFIFISLLAQRNEAKKVHHERQLSLRLRTRLPCSGYLRSSSLRSWTPAPGLGDLNT